MPKRTWLTAFALAVAAATLASAQSQTGSTAAPPPPPPQQKACTAPEYRQFDFWVGNWSVIGPKGATLGANRIESILNGCVIQENWEGGGGTNGTSFNVYQATDKKWHQIWVDNQGSLLLLEGGIKDGKMDMTGTTTNPAGKTVQHRVTWEPMGTTKVRQLWTSSPDDGKTWNTVFDGTYTRKP